jgi:hypothetical protein
VLSGGKGICDLAKVDPLNRNEELTNTCNQHVTSMTSIIKAFGLTVKEFNALSQEVSSDVELRKKVMKQAYIYRLSTDLSPASKSSSIQLVFHEASSAPNNHNHNHTSSSSSSRWLSLNRGGSPSIASSKTKEEEEEDINPYSSGEEVVVVGETIDTNGLLKPMVRRNWWGYLVANSDQDVQHDRVINILKIIILNNNIDGREGESEC